MASATISVTITDTVDVSLATGRDLLMVKWNYLGGGGFGWVPLGTNQDKLNFISANWARYLKSQVNEQLNIQSHASNALLNIDIQ